MSNGKINAIGFAAGIILALLGYSVYKEYLNENDELKKIMILKKAFEEFNCDKYLDEKNKTHLGLINTTNELRNMLLDSLDFKERKLDILYPISVGTLMRSSIEQVVVVYIERQGEKRKYRHFQNEKIMAQILKEKSDNDHVDLMKKMEILMNKKTRKTLNGIVHTPYDIEMIEQTMIEFSTKVGILKFITDTAMLSNQPRKIKLPLELPGA